MPSLPGCVSLSNFFLNFSITVSNESVGPAPAYAHMVVFVTKGGGDVGPSSGLRLGFEHKSLISGLAVDASAVLGLSLAEKWCVSLTESS